MQIAQILREKMKKNIKNSQKPLDKFLNMVYNEFTIKQNKLIETKKYMALRENWLHPPACHAGVAGSIPARVAGPVA